MWSSMKSEKPKTEADFTDDGEGVKSDVVTGQEVWDSGFLSGSNIGGQSEERDHYNQKEEDRNQDQHRNLYSYSSSSTSTSTTTTTTATATATATATTTTSSSSILSLSGDKNNEEKMRTDSGIVEVGLSETLSHLTLKPVTINSLGDNKIRSEPIDIQLTPVTVQSTTDNYQDKNNIKDSTNFQLWRIYFNQDEDGDTQLHIAIVQGFHEVALSLIRMAPHPSLFDCLNQKRQSPLHLAVLTHQYCIARRLVLAGADPGLRNSDGNTALHLAAASGDIECVKALTYPIQISERIHLVPGRQAPAVPQDLEQRNYEGETCLHAAVVAGNTEIVRLLLRVGADLEAKERLGGRTALHLAIECRREGVTSLLLNECRPQLDALTYGGVTPYEIAAAWNSQLAKELVKLGADYENSNEDLSGKMPQLWQNITIGLRA